MIMPNHSTFEQWASSLIIDFPADNIPDFRPGDDWKRWGNTVAEQANFASNGTPTTQGFDDKMTWAVAVYKQMTNFP
jgi:hypothetical protein